MRRRFSFGAFTVFLLIATLFSMFLAEKVEAEPQATIISTSGGIDPGDRQYHVLGEVLNSGDTALERMFPTATFYASNGTVVGTGRGMTQLENLLPGRRAPFEIILREKIRPLKVDHYSLNVSLYPTNARSVGLEILSHRSYIDDGFLYITGEIQSIMGSQTHILILATYYDESGTVVDISSGVSHARSVLDQGEKFQFTEVTWGEQVENITSYRLTVESLGWEVKEEKEGTVDHRLPIVIIWSPTNITYQTDPQLRFNVNEQTSWMGYSLDGQENVTLSEGPLNLTGLSDGSHNLTVFARDTGGNTGSSKTIYFTLDSNPPKISILSPENKTYATEIVSLNFTVNESTSWIEYSLDGQENVTLSENTLNITGLSNGSHYLTVYANDTAGNTGKSETVYFTVAVSDIPIEPITTSVVAVVALVGASVLMYFTIIRKKIQ